MTNQGVCCNVCECVHYSDSNKCKLEKVDITHQKTGDDVVATPHFCKSYEEK